MAEITTNTSTVQSGFIGQFFRNIFDGMILLAESSSRAKAIDALSQVSDQELEARGTTRRDEVIRILGSATWI